MSSVVLRCPNCGTTQAGPGECDACHEAQVRYFCTNHNPGQWLTSSKCPQCNAQFGMADPVRRAALPPPRPSVQPDKPRVPPPFAAAPKRRFNPWGPVAPPFGSVERDVSALRLRERLAGTFRHRRVPDAVPYDRDASPAPARAGCLGRGLLLVVLFLGLLLLLFVSAGGPILQILLGLLLSSHG
jgi:hypothetical protein